ncbi:CubicO group peptidase (beta-lactamase class C family) [Kitasatospora gansuensis]|uniref:CubicO group peptidase (Beta-lactamase class C family) n=1 Tax=Kitasatospora gansuensis TaxID=258050 RepID=A0A7W7SL31_9ACTN|nr:serine hydrolase domain-containing protein [Kitasatospora gansuensis]MBB4944467.1 CubicO group peptidase (beta-lactamase class C family) [Kitasatospora gansuensis]MBB4951863.1 CubicO group peptidase (beta-lactamase class C family) [Kitasatospora gansuensis]MBB4951879.1 CubicO group peptidase (beta-lactamase class C family) [Kitasatospora gansuensis]
MSVNGTVAEGFEGVREEFEAFLAEEPAEPGAQLAAYLDGRLVVDLWSQGVERESLTGVYSVTKGAAHLLVALLVQDGVLELDREVASYWPEFAAEGKGRLTLRELLAHRAGAISVEGGFTAQELADDRLVAGRLAAHKPYWEPGTAHGYHATVIGALTGEVVLRATGRTLQELYEERIRAPYGLDLFLGLPEELEPRFVSLQRAEPTPDQLAAFAAQPLPGKDGLFATSFNLRTDLVDFVNRRETRAKGPASAGGVGSARGVAGMYAAAISGLGGLGPLLKPETVTEFTTLHYPGTDLVTGSVDNFALGFETSGLRYPFLGANAFGHPGVAGAQGFADPASGVAYGYTRRRFTFPPSGGAPENDQLAAAVVAAARTAR